MRGVVVERVRWRRVGRGMVASVALVALACFGLYGLCCGSGLSGRGYCRSSREGL